MKVREVVPSRIGWSVAMGLCVLIYATEARSQQVNPDVAAVGVERIGSLQASVASLRGQVEALERSNRELQRRLDDLAAQRFGAPSEGKPPPGPQGPGIERPPSQPEAELQAWLEFQADVLRAVEPELTRVRGEIAALESRHAQHVHDYMPPPPVGWANWLTVERFSESCPGCLIPFVSPEKATGSGGGHRETSGPKEGGA